MPHRQRWPHCVDWKQEPFIAVNPSRTGHLIEIDTDFIIDTFTLQSYSRSVSAVWDWDLQVALVRMSRRAALQAARLLLAESKGAERFSLEQLVWKGWELPAIWFRAGTNETPHAFMGGIPVKTILDDEVTEHKLAWLTTSDLPAEYPAYHRVMWADETSPADPDSDRLDAIVAEHAAQDQP